MDNRTSADDPGATDAPSLGDYAAWEVIMNKPPSVVREHVVYGYNGMPPRGFCSSCSDVGLSQIVEYMLEEALKNKP